jgi:hypothetical protein
MVKRWQHAFEKYKLLLLEILTKDDHVRKLYAAVRANKTDVIVVKFYRKCLVHVDKRPKIIEKYINQHLQILKNKM